MKTKLLRRLRKNYRLAQREDGLWCVQMMWGESPFWEGRFQTFAKCINFMHVIMKREMTTKIENEKYKKIIKF